MCVILDPFNDNCLMSVSPDVRVQTSERFHVFSPTQKKLTTGIIFLFISVSLSLVL